ncbi:hypothetical protein LTR94_034835, partial [Friedmanniomyces endolithicus]
GADGDRHRRARFAGPRARWRAGRAAGDRASGQHHPGGDGRAGGTPVGGGDRRDQPAQSGRSRAAAPGAVRRADLCRRAERGGAAAHPGDPDAEDAARRRCRPGRDRGAGGAVHRRGPGG